jgi:NAD(P)-dependent dehydrogenase (short-subunit alcohol dehydrogenase family)
MPDTLRRSASLAADAALEATVVLSFSRVGFVARRRLFGWTEPPAGCLAGRVAVVTGATGGLGQAVATRLARLGATVWLLGRDEDRTTALAQRITLGVPGSDVRIALGDLSRPAEVREVAGRLLAADQRLDVLIHNAGALVDRYRRTDDGVEVTGATNLVGPFLLTSLLMPLLRHTSGSRVITVSSGGMYTQRLDVDALDPYPADFRGVAAYARTKRAQVVLNEEWSRRTVGSGVAFHAMHPGWVDTPGLRASLPSFARWMRPLLRSPGEGVDTIIWLACAPEAYNGGRFWHDRRPRSTVRLPGTGTPPGEAERLWAWAAARAGVVSTAGAP